MESSKINSFDFFDKEYTQKLKESLQDEEKRLGNLEKARVELVKELEKLEKEILKEKKKYRNLIDNKLTKEIESIISKYPEEPQNDIKACTSTHQMKIETIDLELSTHLNGMHFDEFQAPNFPDIPKMSKEQYMNSIKTFLSAKGTKNSQ
ncbi:hypothetical protein ACKWTF_012922 [Chironomus riparius]